MTSVTSKYFFHSWHCHRLIKIPKILHFSYKQCQFTQNFAKQLYIFLFPKFLELFITPKNTIPKVKNSKMSLNHTFFWDTLYVLCMYLFMALVHLHLLKTNAIFYEPEGDLRVKKFWRKKTWKLQYWILSSLSLKSQGFWLWLTIKSRVANHHPPTHP